MKSMAGIVDFKITNNYISNVIIIKVNFTILLNLIS